MADISKCKGFGCPLKQNCYRFTAESLFLNGKEYQCYFVNVPYNEKGDGKCSEFWQNKGVVVKNLAEEKRN